MATAPSADPAAHIGKVWPSQSALLLSPFTDEKQGVENTRPVRALPALIVPFLMSVAAAEAPPIIVQAYPWAPFISPMGEPFRPPSSGEAPIGRWFVRADQNHDGMLTADEMQADADRFFTRLDSNRDGQIDPEEITAYESEIAPDVQVNSQWKRPRGEIAAEPESDRDRPAWDSSRKREDRYDGYRTDGLQGAARYGLLNIPQPVASADADFNRLSR